MNHLKSIVSYFLMFPAIFIGTLAMVSYDVPSGIWIQNIIIWILGTVLGSMFIIRNKEKHLIRDNSSQSIMMVALLVLPFFFKGLNLVGKASCHVNGVY